MAVFLSILRITGIVLLCIFLLLLFLVFVVLLVPVRYSGEFKNTDGIAGYGSVSWLLKCFRASFYKEGKESGANLKIFWIFNKSIKIKKKPKKTKEELKTMKKAKRKAKKEAQKHPEFSVTSIFKDPALYEDKRLFGAISTILTGAIRILRHLMPNRISGFLDFGLNSPDKTGNAVAVLSVVFPSHPKYRITPDFDEPKFLTDTTLCGRIFLGYVLWQGVKIILDKDVRFIIKTVQRKKKAFNELQGVPNGKR